MQVLPLGASKGAGVSWLLNRLGVDPAACMALGDGENDLEMLQLVGLGVAMGNAVEAARAVADAATAANSADGVARAVERFVLQPRGLAP
jgi:hydroxymethylpyrimidine pyrophosphatase-like HAD family hydrolase